VLECSRNAEQEEEIADLTHLSIALAQLDVHAGEPESNLARARALAAQAREAGADLLLLPELWLHGYDLEHAREWAAPLTEGGFARMAEMARGSRLHVAGSLFEAHAGGISNTLALFAPDGTLLGSYRKVHLFRPMQEHRYLAPGDRAVVCAAPWGQVGLATCYDLRFPELFRAMALAGAILFLVPAQWPEARLEAWLTLARARAVENELFVAACNRVGREGNAVFPGRSCVVSPLGHTQAEGDGREGIAVACVDLSEVPRVRRYLPVYEDRRPDAYRVKEAGTMPGGAPE
jgi:predicted amidohydrolase